MIVHKISDAIKRNYLNKSALFNPLVKIWKSSKRLYASNDINICYNTHIQSSYDPNKENILIAIESPGIIDHYGWVSPNMKFAAEISFKNYFNLDNYLCPRTIYAGNDNFVDMPDAYSEMSKPNLVSIVYSSRRFILGHKYRHEIAETCNCGLDLFGSGTGVHMKNKSDSLTSYMFQVVVENEKYPEYVSEKFFDCLKLGVVPIYWGGEEAIRKMGFDERGLLYFDSIEDLKELMSASVNPEYYQSILPYIKSNWERLKEIRNEDKLALALNTVKYGYHHTTGSYHGLSKRNLNLGFK